MSVCAGPNYTIQTNPLVIDARGPKGYQTTYLDSLSSDSTISLVNGQRISENLISADAGSGTINLETSSLSITLVCRTQVSDVGGIVLTIGQSSTQVSSTYSYSDYLENADLEHGSTGLMQWGIGNSFTYQDYLENVSFNIVGTSLNPWGVSSLFTYQDYLENVSFSQTNTGILQWGANSSFIYTDNLENVTTSGEVRAFPLINNKLIINYNLPSGLINTSISQGPAILKNSIPYSTVVSLFHILWYTEANIINLDIYYNGTLYSSMSTSSLRETILIPGNVSLFSEYDLTNIGTDIALGYLSICPRKLTETEIFNDYQCLKQLII